MNREKFIKSGMIKFGDFTLTSGKKSTDYVDIKEACTDPESLSEICDELVQISKDAYNYIVRPKDHRIYYITALCTYTGRYYLQSTCQFLDLFKIVWPVVNTYLLTELFITLSR